MITSGTYTTDWVAMKTRWGLAIDGPEQAALTDALGGCPDITIAVTRAR